jgi:hypothetical protein
VGHTADGADLCGPCADRPNLLFACRACGGSGDLYLRGLCARCVATSEVHALLGDADGVVLPALRPLADVLTAAERPRSLLGWLRESPSVELLAAVKATSGELDHALLDQLPQSRNLHYVRDLLLAAGLLPSRHENLAKLTVWIAHTVPALPPHQQRVIRPYAEWEVLRDARRRAGRDPARYTISAAANDRGDVRGGITFLTWLDGLGVLLRNVTQHHIDIWLSDHNGLRASGHFLRWCSARRLITDIEIPTKKKTMPTKFLSETEHTELLRRFLNDDTLPLEMRIVGALAGLYSVPITQAVALTVDRFTQDDAGAYLLLDQHTVPLPPRLAQLIERQITLPRRTAMLDLQPIGAQRFLLPGRRANKPRSATALIRAFREHGIPIAAIRNNAMLDAITNLPPIVVSDLFGRHPTTTHAWARYTATSWASYLAARRSTNT